MRLLLDENLPKRLKQDFSEHEIYTASDKGCTGISNGRLLELLIENDFNALITFDKNLQFQQNLKRYTIGGRQYILNVEETGTQHQRHIKQ